MTRTRTRTRTTAGSLGLSLVLVAGLAPVATADEPVEPPPTVAAIDALRYPVPRGTTIVIDGPRTMWRLRAFAERMDAALPGIEVVSAPHTAYPDAFHVSVVKVYAPDASWAGYCSWSYDPARPGATTPTDSTVQLNTLFRRAGRLEKRRIAAHEFMHVLGMTHHVGTGLVGSSYELTPEPEPSADEWAALHAYYG